MNIHFAQIQMKERQRELDEELRRIHQARAAGNQGPGLFEGLKGLFRRILLSVSSWLSRDKNMYTSHSDTMVDSKR